MSIEIHLNVNAIELMLQIYDALNKNLRGMGVNIPLEVRFELAKDAAIKLEEAIDKEVTL